jgi:hypothetical protein
VARWLRPFDLNFSTPHLYHDSRNSALGEDTLANHYFRTTSSSNIPFSANILVANMVSRVLMGIWAALDFFLLAAGAVSLALSLVWRRPDVLMNMVLSRADLTGMFN